MRNQKHVKPKLPRMAYGIDEIAEALGVSGGFIRLELARGRLSAIRCGRRVLITRESFEKYSQAAE